MDGTDKIVDKLLETSGLIDGHDGNRKVVPIVRCSRNKRVKIDFRMTCWNARFTLVIVVRLHLRCINKQLIFKNWASIID